MIRARPNSTWNEPSFGINRFTSGSKSFKPCRITLRAQTSMRCKWAHLLPGLPFHHICNQKCAALKHHASRGVRLVLVSMRRQVILVARHFSSVLKHFSWRNTAECANGGPLIQRTQWTFPLFPRKRSNLQWDLEQGCEQSPSTTHKSVCRDVQPPKSPPHSSFFFSCLIFFPTQLQPEKENFPSLFFFFFFMVTVLVMLFSSAQNGTSTPKALLALRSLISQTGREKSWFVIQHFDG